MVVTPPETPVTMPDDEPIVAFVGALLVHVPPVVPILASAVDAVWQTVVVPEIAVGIAFTVNTTVLNEPLVVA